MSSVKVCARGEPREGWLSRKAALHTLSVRRSPSSIGISNSVVFPEPLAPASTLYAPSSTASLEKQRYRYASMREITVWLPSEACRALDSPCGTRNKPWQFRGGHYRRWGPFVSEPQIDSSH